MREGRTGLADTPRRKALWSLIYERVYSATGRRALAVKTANSAIVADCDRAMRRRMRAAEANRLQPRLF